MIFIHLFNYFLWADFTSLTGQKEYLYKILVYIVKSLPPINCSNLHFTSKIVIPFQLWILLFCSIFGKVENYCYYFLRFYLFLFREEGREKERERNIDVREKHQLVACCTCPDWVPNLQPRCVLWLGIERVATFCFAKKKTQQKWCPMSWATRVRVKMIILLLF